MMTIIGFVVVLVGVIGGYVLHHGNLQVLVQPTELMIICGAALGSLIIMSPPSVLKEIVTQLIGTLKDGGPSKTAYLELMGLLFELCKTAKANPLSLEPHIEKPEGSEIFKKYPGVLKNHHAIHFLCDTLKVQLSASMSPYDLEDLMKADLDTVHHSEHKAPEAVGKVADAFPGLGIVAAVLGVVITMGKLTEGKEVIGQSVAAALVGTFIGVLFCYGFVGPLSAKMAGNLDSQGKYMLVIKATLLAYAKDCSPKVCVEFGRREIPPESRPTFEELDKATSATGSKAS